MSVENEKSAGRIIDLTINNGYEVFKDSFDERAESIHYDLYKKGIKIIKKMIGNSEIIDGKGKDINMSNVILFSGERGTGKSSSMNSFAKFLNDPNFIEVKEKFSVSEIETIDPTLLNANDSLVETVVAKLFDGYLNKVEEKSFPNEISDQRKILEQFKKVYGCIKTIHEDKKDRFKNELYTENTIETIQRLGGSFNLKKELLALVNEYLKQMSNDKEVGGDKGNRFLLIKIDDLDMNISHAYAMLEEIRKYLNLPNVIILLAAYEGQLIDVLKDSFYQQFAEIKNMDEGEKFEIREKIQIMADKYLIKLLPLEYRLYLIDLEEKFDEIDTKYKNGENEVTVNAKELILEKIYSKTRLIFLNDKFGKNALVPTNLREYVQFAKFLLSLQDVKSNSIKDIDDAEERSIILKNLLEFKHYFINGRVKNKLDFDSYQLIEEIFDIDSDKVNTAVQNFLVKKYQLGTKTNDLKGLGNVIDIIEELKVKYVSPKDTFLLTTIYASYSIRIFELILKNDGSRLDELKVTKVNHYNLPLYDIFGEDIFGCSSIQMIWNDKKPGIIQFIRNDIKHGNRERFRVSGFYTQKFKPSEKSNIDIKFRYYLTGKSPEASNDAENKAIEACYAEKGEALEFFLYFLQYGRGTDSKLRLRTRGMDEREYLIFDVKNPFFYTLYNDFCVLRTDNDKIMSIEKIQNLNTQLMFPIYSIDFIVMLRNFVWAEVKDEAKDYFTYVKAFYESFSDNIQYIIDKNKHLTGSKILENYKENTFIKKILTYKDENEACPEKIALKDNETEDEMKKRETRDIEIEQYEADPKIIGLKSLINRLWEVYTQETPEVISKKAGKLQKVSGYSVNMTRADDFIEHAKKCIEIVESNQAILPAVEFKRYIDEYRLLIKKIELNQASVDPEYSEESKFGEYQWTLNNLRYKVNRIINHKK